MNTINRSEKTPAHYYGDYVRAAFLLAAVIMLVSLPSFGSVLRVPVIVSVGSILVLGLAAGLTNPKQKWDAGVNMVLAAIGFLIFESVAVIVYQQDIATPIMQRFFITNLGLGLIFLAALYFAVKTFRAALMTQPQDVIK